MAFREVAVTEIREVLRPGCQVLGCTRWLSRRAWTARPPAGMWRRRRPGWPVTAGRGSWPMSWSAGRWGGPAGAAGRARAAVGADGGLPGRDRRPGEGGPVGRQDRCPAGAAGHHGAVRIS